MSKLLDEKRKTWRKINNSKDELEKQKEEIGLVLKICSPPEIHLLNVSIEESGIRINGFGPSDGNFAYGSIQISDDLAIKVCQALKGIYEL